MYWTEDLRNSVFLESCILIRKYMKSNYTATIIILATGDVLPFSRHHVSIPIARTHLSSTSFYWSDNMGPKKSPGSPGQIYDDRIKINLWQKMDRTEWSIFMTHGKIKWRAFMNTNQSSGSTNGVFCTRSATTSFSKITLLLTHLFLSYSSSFVFWHFNCLSFSLF